MHDIDGLTMELCMSTKRKSRLWLVARIFAFSLAAVGLASESVAEANAQCYNCLVISGFGTVCDPRQPTGWTNCYTVGDPGGMTCSQGGNVCGY